MFSFTLFSDKSLDVTSIFVQEIGGCLKCKFETASLWGWADLGKKRRSWGREAYKSTSSPENGGRKSPIKIEIRKDFYLIIVSFTVFLINEVLFIILRTFSVLLNVTAPVFYFSSCSIITYIMPTLPSRLSTCK